MSRDQILYLATLYRKKAAIATKSILLKYRTSLSIVSGTSVRTTKVLPNVLLWACGKLLSDSDTQWVMSLGLIKALLEINRENALFTRAVFKRSSARLILISVQAISKILSARFISSAAFEQDRATFVMNYHYCIKVAYIKKVFIFILRICWWCLWG